MLRDGGYFHVIRWLPLAFTPALRDVSTLQKCGVQGKIYGEQSKRCLEAQSPHLWIQTNVPQQNSSWACGYYILKNIMKFTKVLKYKPHILYAEVKNAKTKCHLKHRP